jgi:transcriptional regulator with XRE-family HTH domain
MSKKIDKPDQESSDKFARALGEALRRFLDENGIKVTEAAARLGMNKQTLSSYWTDNAKGQRNHARAELLFLACVELGFVFEYEGRSVSAIRPSGVKKNGEARRRQLVLPFMRTFELADQNGRISLSVKRPSGRVELSLSMKAIS